MAIPPPPSYSVWLTIDRLSTRCGGLFLLRLVQTMLIVAAVSWGWNGTELMAQEKKATPVVSKEQPQTTKGTTKPVAKPAAKAPAKPVTKPTAKKPPAKPVAKKPPVKVATKKPVAKPAAKKTPAKPVAQKKPTVTKVAALSTAPGTFAPGKGLSARDQSLARAMDLAERSDWNGANRILDQLKADKDIRKIALWLYILSGDGQMDPLVPSKFLKENPQWPSPKVTQRRAEDGFVREGNDEQVINWFAAYPPTTGPGAIRLAEALLAHKQDKLAQQWLEWGWITGSFSRDQEQEIMQKFGKRLSTDHHIQRLDALVWDGERDGALRMFNRVPLDYRILAEARMALRTDAGNADVLVAAVPAKLSKDSGLVYERVRWRRAKGMDSEARQLLLTQRGDPARPDLWWRERHYLAREAVDFGEYKVAYQLAAGHGNSEGVPFAEAEFFAGWVALRFLKDSGTAKHHFVKLHDGVTFPISKSRAAYWAGRASEAGRDQNGAHQWYNRAAAYGPYFYGQLGKAKLVARAGPPVQAMPVLSKADVQQFDQNELTLAARLLARLGDEEKARVILLAMVESAKNQPKQQALIGRLSKEIGGYDLAVRVAKTASQQGVEMVEVGYPVDYVGKFPLPVENALALAIARQESEFNTRAVSPVGARGLMQLMPATARQQASKLKMRYSPEQLNDPYYNLKLGGDYLGRLIKRFDGSYVLAIASYNAGQGRIAQWIEKYGDPRTGEIDIIDWMERIPYSETRNYVQRVMEAVEIYRYRLAGSKATHNLEDDLMRGIIKPAKL